MERVDHFGLSPCPFCGGKVFFHGHAGDDNCHGCHHIECTQCKAMIDMSETADPANSAFALTDLRRRIAKFWNRRANSAGGDHAHDRQP